MEIIFLSEESNVDPASEFTITDISSIKNCYNKLHTHDYFEILFVVEGNFLDFTNGQVSIKNEGTLIFFRPCDTHRIEMNEDKDCHLINITFSKKTTQELLHYLGDGFDSDPFLYSSNPQKVLLDNTQKMDLHIKLEQLNVIAQSDKKRLRTNFHFILSELFYKYLFTQTKINKKNIPDWLNKLCENMSEKENFSRGASAMIELSGKNHSYLCRTFKKYLNTNPTDFINEFRLSFASNLLINSDKNVLNICYEVGFDSLGHFYKLFKEKFDLPPLQYRKKHWNSSHLWS